jgi:hypothetical protein
MFQTIDNIHKGFATIVNRRQHVLEAYRPIILNHSVLEVL